MAVRDALTDDTWLKDLRYGDVQPLLPDYIHLHRLIVAAATELREGSRDQIHWKMEAKGQY